MGVGRGCGCGWSCYRWSKSKRLIVKSGVGSERLLEHSETRNEVVEVVVVLLKTDWGERG